MIVKIAADVRRSCTVAVKIKNQGETAYQQSLYGEAIIVERTFTISGSSGFKLKSSNGRIISTKKSDLDDITDFYALQLDNPLSVLTQDNARQFLNASTPADKYKFFMKGVQLEQLNQDYELLQDSIQQVENTFEDKQMHINNLEAKKAEADKNWIALVRTDNIRDEINTLRVKMAWAQVEDQENLLMAHDAELELFQVKLEDTQLEVQTITQTLDIKDQEQSQKHERVKDLENELAAKQEAKKDRKEEYDKVMEDMTESQVSFNYS
jgi:chromosome segregation ATPase